MPAVHTRLVALAALTTTIAHAQVPDPSPWKQHSLDRPQPKVVTPAPAGPMTPPPSDATVLFDGKSLSGWTSMRSPGEPARWKVENGYMEVSKGGGDLRSNFEFGDAQVHVEWATPANPPDSLKSQERGNSGVYLMAKYELQVLDSYNNPTYADGQAASIYGQFPPLVNASRKPGEWQTYDIVWHRPHFDAAGNVTAQARMTVYHNGILVQDDTHLIGPTTHMVRRPYVAHGDKGPLMLQDHGDPIRYRNIWVRELP